jgi:hypothetical protein
MKLTEKQAFKIIDLFFRYFGNPENITEEEKADFCMMELLNLELEK